SLSGPRPGRLGGNGLVRLAAGKAGSFVTESGQRDVRGQVGRQAPLRALGLGRRPAGASGVGSFKSSSAPRPLQCSSCGLLCAAFKVAQEVFGMLLSLALVAQVSLPTAPKAFPFPVDLHTLPNGLRVGLVQYDSPG